MTAEERATSARQIVSDYLDHAFGATFLTPTDEGMVERITAALTEFHATGKAEGEREGLEKAAAVAEARMSSWPSGSLGPHVAVRTELRTIATAIRNLIPGEG
jgi:hypothetical protein